MDRHEWLRRRTWTEADKRDFYAHLHRARTAFHKAQYLRIRAFTLERYADPPRITAALELIEEMLRDYPDASQIAQAYHQQTTCFIALGRFEDALEAVQRALEAERLFPGTNTGAYLDYAHLVLRLDYAEARQRKARTAQP
jgi:tetratricopeptide (TPR) repeat protein